MFAILAYSAAVSLATLGILLLRRTLPTRMTLWTHRYGTEDASTAKRLKISSPPLILWLLVLLTTISFAAAYYRDQSESLSHDAQIRTTVWIDHSLSSHIALKDMPDLRSQIVDRILRVAREPFVIRASTSWGASSRWENRVEIVPATTRDLLEDELARPPSPFAFDLTPESLKLAYDALGGAAEQQGRLIIVSDGQRGTLQKWGALAELYSDLLVIEIPGKSLQVAGPKEIVPARLLESWGHGGQVAPSADPTSFAWYEGLSKMPAEARPGLFLGDVTSSSSSEVAQKEVGSGTQRSEVFSLDGGYVGQGSEERKAGGVIFTHCSRVPVGPPELSPLADLQVLARFFSIKVRTTDCREETSRQATKPARNDMPLAVPSWIDSTRAMDPWHFRRASLWLVPLAHNVFNTLLYQHHLWLPEGFRMGSDALFYYADPGLLSAQRSAAGLDRGGSLSIRQHLVQLEKSGIPMGIVLAPPPPVLEVDDAEGRFASVVRAYDETDLVYRLGNNRIYYLRTPLAMPNGELGRTGFWASFWLRALSQTSSTPGGLLIHHFATPDAVELPAPGDLLRLDPTSLRFLGSRDDKGLLGPLTTGLFLEPKTGHLHLVEYPPSERSGQFLDEGAIRDMVPVHSPKAALDSPASSSQRAKRTPLHTVLGALAGLLALGAYWIRLHRTHAAANSATLAKVVAALALTGSAIGSRTASAQGLVPTQLIPMLSGGEQRLPEPISVAFRVGWCAAEPSNRQTLATGFKKFRDLLAERGTIHLQDELRFGACTPGAAEIWWTDNPDDLDPNFLKIHVQSGGIFVVEGFSPGGRQDAPALPQEVAGLDEPSVGLRWEQPEKRGMLYRSFYLLQTFDGCVNDRTMMLTLRKKQTAKSPAGIVTSSSFFGMRPDCFKHDDDYRGRSFVNLMYALLTTDYKEDQLQLPELLRRVRNLGLEP